MLMDDYLLHLLEAELERQQQRDFERKIFLLRGGQTNTSHTVWFIVVHVGCYGSCWLLLVTLAWFMLAPVGCSWFLLAALLVPIGCSWFLLDALGSCGFSCWFLLVALGSCWLLLVCVSFCWLLLVPVESCWFLLVALHSCGSCWLFLVPLGSLVALGSYGFCWFLWFLLVPVALVGSPWFAWWSSWFLFVTLGYCYPLFLLVPLVSGFLVPLVVGVVLYFLFCGSSLVPILLSLLDFQVAPSLSPSLPPLSLSL